MFHLEEIAAEFTRQTPTTFDRQLLAWHARARTPYRLGWLPTSPRAMRQTHPTWMYAWWPVKRARAVAAVLDALRVVTW